MRRTVVTVGGDGMLSIPSSLKNLWMSEGGLVDMLHVTAPKLNSVIQAIYKEGMLLMSGIQQRQELSKGIWQTLYGFPMVVAVCSRLTSNGATQLRDAIFKRLYGVEEKTAIVLQLYRGTNTFSWEWSHFWRLDIHCHIDLLIYCRIDLLIHRILDRVIYIVHEEEYETSRKFLIRSAFVGYRCSPLILKKCMKIKMILIALVASLSLTNYDDDDSGIQLAQDEITDDINIGKKVMVTSPATYTESSSKVNVNGVRDKISATSSDESIAKVSCSANKAEKEVYVSGVSVGNTTITITGSDGNAAVLKVEAKDWTTLWELSRTMYVVDRKCFAKGVSSEDSATITAGAIEKDLYNKYYTIRTCVYIPSGPYATKRLTTTDDKENVRMDGILKIQPNAGNPEIWHLLPIGNYTGVVLATFYYDQKSIVKDATGYYKTAYPKIRRAELYAVYAVEELEPDK